MKDDLNTLVMKLSKDINAPAYSVFKGVRKAVKSRRISKKQLVALIRKMYE